MNVPDRPAPGFALACPACGQPRPAPVGQINHFEFVRRVGDFEVGERHTATSRKYVCIACNHAWTTTRPFDEVNAAAN